jgi:hypothetical protein
MFEDVAPVATDAALLALEHTMLKSGDDGAAQGCEHYLHLVRALAYDAKSFERCTALILKIAEA